MKSRCLLLACGSLFAACSDTPSAPTNTGTPDTGTAVDAASDANGDAGQAIDAAREATTDRRTVTLQFATKLGSKSFKCTESYEIGSAATKVEPLDMRFYVHSVVVENANGERELLALKQDGKWQSGNVALLDFEDKSGTCTNGTVDVNSSIIGTVAPNFGAVEKIQFIVGVPAELNHQDATLAASPLNLSSLSWDWTTGYKFIRADFRIAASTPAKSYLLHLGSTACSPTVPGVNENCTNTNRPIINLANFKEGTSTVVFDYASVVSGLNVAENQGGAPGCMSAVTDPECAAVFPKLGLDLVSGTTTSNQAAFRLE
jgi:uncharacterized repeat protein (TIGR04052 family)